LNDQLDATAITELSQVAELEQERELDVNSNLQVSDAILPSFVRQRLFNSLTISNK